MTEQPPQVNWSRIDERMDAQDRRLDKLTDALERLTRNEERISAVRSLQATQAEEVKILMQRVSELERTQGRNVAIVGAVERAFWIAATAIVGYFAAKFK